MECPSSSKKEDELSDDERAGQTQETTEAMCTSHPWNHGVGTLSADAAVAVPRSVSNATTIPSRIQK